MFERCTFTTWVSLFNYCRIEPLLFFSKSKTKKLFWNSKVIGTTFKNCRVNLTRHFVTVTGPFRTLLLLLNQTFDAVSNHDFSPEKVPKQFVFHGGGIITLCGPNYDVTIQLISNREKVVDICSNSAPFDFPQTGVASFSPGPLYILFLYNQTVCVYCEREKRMCFLTRRELFFGPVRLKVWKILFFFAFFSQQNMENIGLEGFVL